MTEQKMFASAEGENKMRSIYVCIQYYKIQLHTFWGHLIIFIDDNDII